MTALDAVVAMVLADEGGLNDVPGDAGGVTNCGITVPWLSDRLGRPATADDVRALTPVSAGGYYRQWLAETKLDQCLGPAPDGDLLAAALVSWAVDSGAGVAIRALERRLGLAADGAIGPLVLGALAGADRDRLGRQVAADWQRFYSADAGDDWRRRLAEIRALAPSAQVVALVEGMQVQFIAGWTDRVQRKVERGGI